MRTFILLYLLLASSVLADGPPLFRDTTNKVTSRMSEWDFNSATQDLDAGSNKITSLGSPTADGDAAPKSYVDGQAGTNPIGQNLTLSSTTLTPSAKSKYITLFPPTSSLSTGVIFNHSFNGQDADFAIGTDTGTFNLGSPVVTNGLLDLTNGNDLYEASSIRFDGDNIPHNWVNLGTEESFQVRLLFRPNWNGNPSSEVTLVSKVNNPGAATNASSWRIFIDTIGRLRVQGYNTGGSATGLNGDIISRPQGLWLKGELYQIDFSMVWQNTGTTLEHQAGYVNGQWGGIATKNGSIVHANTGHLIFGGENGGFGSETAPGFSNHKIEGITIWSEDDGTDVRQVFLDTTNIDTIGSTMVFSPTYDIDGGTSGFETIDTIIGTLYEAGDIVTFENGQAGATVTFEPATTLGPGKLDLASRFTSRSAGDKLVLQYTGSYWIEIGRHFVGCGTGHDLGCDTVTLTAAGDTITTLGGSEVTVLGSETSLPVDLVFKVDYSDNSLEPDFVNGGTADLHYDPGLFNTVDVSASVSGGELVLNDAAADQRSGYIYIGDAYSLPHNSYEGTYRMLVTPDYSGTPTDDIAYFTRTWHNSELTGCPKFQGSPVQGCRYMQRLLHRTANGNLRWEVYNNGAVLYALEAAYSPTAGQEDEIEVSFNYTTGHIRIFINGTLAGTNATLAGADWTVSIGTAAIGMLTSGYGFGGLDQFSLNYTPGQQCRSRHNYSGFAAFDTEQHTANYTPAGLPGASAAFETITKMDASLYQEDQLVTLRVGEASRFSLSDNASPTADQFALNGNWAPTSTDEVLVVRKTGTYWTEIGRFPAAAGAVAAHDLGGAEHNADSLADLNTKVSDATLVDGVYIPRIQDATPETATFTAVLGETHVVNLSGGSFTANLPAVASGNGQIRFHVNGTSGQLTVDGNASETIDGKLTLKIRSGTTTITNDGTEWHILQRTARSPNRLDPAQITADQDPYNPADWDNTVTHLYIDSDATRTIQGFDESVFVEMDQVIVFNDGSNDIVIAHDNATVAADSVLVDGSANFTLGPNKGGILIRDGTVNKWRFYAMVTPALETSVQVMAASATVNSTTDRVHLDGNSATVTATLFNCDATSDGSKVRFVATDITNPLSVAADAGDSILGGAPTFTVVGDSATFICYGAGAEWEVY